VHGPSLPWAKAGVEWVGLFVTGGRQRGIENSTKRKSQHREEASGKYREGQPRGSAIETHHPGRSKTHAKPRTSDPRRSSPADAADPGSAASVQTTSYRAGFLREGSARPTIAPYSAPPPAVPAPGWRRDGHLRPSITSNGGRQGAVAKGKLVRLFRRAGTNSNRLAESGSLKLPGRNSRFSVLKPLGQQAGNAGPEGDSTARLAALPVGGQFWISG